MCNLDKLLDQARLVHEQAMIYHDPDKRTFSIFLPQKEGQLMLIGTGLNFDAAMFEAKQTLKAIYG